MSLSKMSQSQDIRELWTRATMSQSNIPVSLTEVCQVSNPEGSSSGTSIAEWYFQDSNIDLEEQDSGEERVALRRVGTTDMNRSSQRRQSEPSLSLDRHNKTTIIAHESKVDANHCPLVFPHPRSPFFYFSSRTPSSIISLPGKYAPHQPYWLEQHTRLPLPLVELMENEALEILTKALKSYRSGIGNDHGLTQELQRYVEGLRRRRSKRAKVVAQRKQQPEEETL
ncbi:cation channel sperm-associated auxiliary subunit zeta [Suncus etruscus]|uniref:cation channel sperm-associated auxiliary subunit zeta n=1 Tax=Suncus etruscus TaxID=109475 RepID=UPI00210F5E8B|nr:cation channel sperm-associated auxiliary subunit zeta [Suncus etruscus]